MINKELFKSLRAEKGQHLVSMYIPTEITGDYQKNKIRWKNAIKKAEESLRSRSLHESTINKILDPARDKVNAQNFWEYQSAGLAGFFSEGTAEIINMAYAPAERTIVEDEFILYPLIPTLLSQERIFILTLSLKDVRFFEAHEHAIYPVKIDDLVPTALDQLEQVEKKESLQMYSTGGKQSQFHGHPESHEKDDVRVEQFFRFIDNGMQPIFKGEEVPLVLAGVKKQQTIYRRISQYKHIHDFSIDVHPDQSDPVALHTEVLPLFKEMKVSSVREIEKEFDYMKSEGLASEGLKQSQKAAEFKNIDKMLVYGYENELYDEEKNKNSLILAALDQGADIRFVSSEESDRSGLLSTHRFKIE